MLNKNIRFLFVVIQGVSILSSDWAIYPPVGQEFLNQQSQTIGYQGLKKLGEQAHDLWLSDSNPSKRGQGLDKVFAQVDKSCLVSTIDDILSSESLLEEVTKASYKNVTGFLKIVLMSGGKDSWKLRLHVWEQEEKEYPHNHKWDFFSKIMTGYLVQNLYGKQNKSAVDSKEYCVCEPVSLMPIKDGEKPCPCRDSYVLSEKEEVDKVFLKQVDQSILGIGESYFMSNHLIHTINPGKHAISFVFTSQHCRENSEVFVPTELVGTDLTKYAPSVTKEELIRELSFIKVVLQRLSLSKRYLPELIHPQHGYFSRDNNFLALQDWRQAVLGSQPLSRVKQLHEIEVRDFIVSSNENHQVSVGLKPMGENKEYLFVLLDNVMYASPKNFSHAGQELICHTSFTDYASVDAAGILIIDSNGDLIAIEAYSGHYEPSIEHMSRVKDYLASIGVDVTKASIINYADRH